MGLTAAGKRPPTVFCAQMKDTNATEPICICYTGCKLGSFVLTCSRKKIMQFADFNKDGYHLHLIGLGVIRVIYSVVAIQNQTELRD